MKTYVLTLSKVFPAYHIRKGEPTNFKEAFKAGQVFNRGAVGSCPICDGSGNIDEEVRTPTGKKIPQEDSIIKLGKGYFKWHHFRTIIKTCKMLDIEQIRLVRTHETEMSILELSKDIHIGFMPMYVDDEDGIKIKKRAISVKGIKE